MKTHIPVSGLSLISSAAAAQDVGRVSPALEAYSKNDLFGSVWTGEKPSVRDRALVTFATLMTRHETPAELSETITHPAFYTGWGNATAAAEAAAPVFAARGIVPEDLPAVDPGLLPLDEEAEDARETLVRGNYGDVSMGVFDTKRDLLFRDLWLRPDLAPRDRSMVTVAALIAAGQPEQMTFHLNRATENGLTQAEAGAMLSHLAFYAGWPKVFSALPVAKAVFEIRNR
ncbi:4-carboxymuconolactone decarboxylase [Rhodovulum viride]|uniref:4-carboxymuconolactone decarboxylase n=1 Tax=Rhodovulum viride TaxID=1231134 RepID=A0ABX9DKT5_9RHOB|nr:carboxymuconolactone decarboxylase family protein [Rhodovulum viride]RAP42191.1 4-carboxymuconolactone decarboxylase [Rhodovulum viride]